VPYAIDFMNPAPDLDINSLTPHYFNWAVEHMADMAIRLAQNPQEQKPAFFGDGGGGADGGTRSRTRKQPSDSDADAMRATSNAKSASASPSASEPTRSRKS